MLQVLSGQYEFNKLPFGLSNNPSSFQLLVDIVLKILVCMYCYVYLDDVIFSQTALEHAPILENILHRFDRVHLPLNPNKCVIAKPQELPRVLAFRKGSFSLT